MTNKEAIAVLRGFKFLPKEQKAVELAIKALEQSEEKPRSEWILKETDCDDGGNNRYECSKCHFTDIHSDSADVPYCWHCGSIMKGGVK